MQGQSLQDEGVSCFRVPVVLRHPRSGLMTVRITCPDCDATLKLAKAPAPGKKVKCPKCEALFVPSDEEKAEADDPDRPVKTAARKAKGPKPKPKAAAA